MPEAPNVATALPPLDPLAVDKARERLETQKKRIAAAALAVNRDPLSIELLAVGKNHPATALHALYAAGHRAFGENYAQELAGKALALKALPDLKLSFIGTIQSNKLKQIVAAADAVQTVTTVAHAAKIAALAASLNKDKFTIWLAVNAGDEATKNGVPMAEAEALGRGIAAAFPNLTVAGLMAIPPPLSPTEKATIDPPPLYLALHQLASRVGAGKLSLGMSDDLAHAVRAGATTVRIGTALFGQRPKRST